MKFSQSLPRNLLNFQKTGICERPLCRWICLQTFQIDIWKTAEFLPFGMSKMPLSCIFSGFGYFPVSFIFLRNKRSWQTAEGRGGGHSSLYQRQAGSGNTPTGREFINRASHCTHATNLFACLEIVVCCSMKPGKSYYRRSQWSCHHESG